MRASIGCSVVLLSAMGIVTEAAGVSDAVLAGNRGLSPIIFGKNEVERSFPSA